MGFTEDLTNSHGSVLSIGKIHTGKIVSALFRHTVGNQYRPAVMTLQKSGVFSVWILGVKLRDTKVQLMQQIFLLMHKSSLQGGSMVILRDGERILVHSWEVWSETNGISMLWILTPRADVWRMASGQFNRSDWE